VAATASAHPAKHIGNAPGPADNPAYICLLYVYFSFFVKYCSPNAKILNILGPRR